MSWRGRPIGTYISYAIDSQRVSVGTSIENESKQHEFRAILDRATPLPIVDLARDADAVLQTSW